jgi:subfamily B ATP-binding cassette protein HlyB/CyaB
MPAPQPDPAMTSHPIPSPQEVNTGLVCLFILTRDFGITADGAQLRHGFGLSAKPGGDTGVLRIATHLGLRAGKRSATWARLMALPLPAIAQYTARRYMVLGQVDGERVLVQELRKAHPLTLARRDFAAVWNRTLILLTTRARLGSIIREFDVTWFLQAILKYRKLLGEVLLASFFLQGRCGNVCPQC